jgi:hypothetical protein
MGDCLMAVKIARRTVEEGAAVLAGKNRGARRSRRGIS